MYSVCPFPRRLSIFIFTVACLLLPFLPSAGRVWLLSLISPHSEADDNGPGSPAPRCLQIHTEQEAKKLIVLVIIITKNLHFARYIFASLPGFPKITQACIFTRPSTGVIRHMPFL
ncbi:uncharacterized protein BO80DRAFT_177345 [Aspergillus ibericus CBS 121593]|uniref:Uncharacterized protein n=1 Tax=Aspergillus ibericus CBS 121593 TaxID=1448316 RepID=A0A395HDP3_9EURO|nr:hypothetical protein BO80DRAFT_177345 [Aspergillus ibericus CBS 121593]RAL05108.1 hypothetical protein BO80DRAFT_177345 [Aspergillus ibericus CBS 121593]